MFEGMMFFKRCFPIKKLNDEKEKFLIDIFINPKYFLQFLEKEMNSIIIIFIEEYSRTNSNEVFKKGFFY